MSLSYKFDFVCALPVWEKGRQTEKNVSIVLRSFITKSDSVRLCVAACSKYQIFVNGSFFASGPARASHGFYRVGEYDLSSVLTEEKNTVAIIAAGYNVNSYYLLDEPSFICAEIIQNGKVAAATGCGGFEAMHFNGRLQRVMRYSFQRPFSESYVLDAWYDGFLNGRDEPYRPVTLERCGEKKFITQTTPHPEHTEEKSKTTVARGILVPTKGGKARKYEDRSYLNIGDTLKGFRPEELESDPVKELLSYSAEVLERETLPASSVELGINCFSVYDMGEITTGYIRLSVTAQNDVVLYAVFGEKLNENGVPEPGTNMGASVVQWSIQGGRSYDLVSFEPYTFRFVSVISMYAPVLLTNVSVYGEKFPSALIKNVPVTDDPKLQKIYNSSINTFRQCVTDIYMDCPSRERAGWLCDSFFTARAEAFFTGENRVEDAFIENYLLPDSFADIPDGMLPMCYPADHYDGCFIPNWAMWFVLELNDRRKRCADDLFIARARDRVYALASCFEKYENGDGLLEKLDGWVFADWSAANDFRNDINYPTNMLYAVFLDCIGEMYSDKTMHEKAEKLRKKIREKSFNGTFFRDNDVYKDGRIEKTNNITEACQYYAFFTETATKETYPELWDKLVNVLTPSRNRSEVYPEIHPANIFIGYILRLKVLLNEGLYNNVINEAKELLLPMAESTGTLWEHTDGCSSRCHGFASYAAVLLNEAENGEKNTNR